MGITVQRVAHHNRIQLFIQKNPYHAYQCNCARSNFDFTLDIAIIYHLHHPPLFFLFFSFSLSPSPHTPSSSLPCIGSFNQTCYRWATFHPHHYSGQPSGTCQRPCSPDQPVTLIHLYVWPSGGSRLVWQTSNSQLRGRR